MIVIRGARVVTMDGRLGPVRRGGEMSELGVVDPGDVYIEDGYVREVRRSDAGGAAPAPAGWAVIEARGRVCMPAFVDCHTHACWAGDRLGEWEQKRQGASYLGLLKAGGGIMATVRAVRAASEDELRDGLRARLEYMLSEGTCTVEVKSGYGLTAADELKMLRAIAGAGQEAGRWAGTVVPTACIGHALDPEVGREVFVQRVIGEMLPAVHAEFPGIAIDAYCEEGAWNLEECVRLFERAAELGHPLRVHADQFHALGMVEAAIGREWSTHGGRGFVSVDHLEATSAESLRRLAASEVMGVMLPCSGFHCDGRYGDGRGLIEAGGGLAIATNWNPGSAPCGSMPAAIALATRFLGRDSGRGEGKDHATEVAGNASPAPAQSPSGTSRPDRAAATSVLPTDKPRSGMNCARGISAAEAICAATVNSAAVLGLSDRGRITPGARADLVLLRHTDERMLAQEFGGRHVDVVVCGGRVVG